MKSDVSDLKHTTTPVQRNTCMFLRNLSSVHTVIGSGRGLVSAAFQQRNLRSLSAVLKFSHVSKSREQTEESSGVCFASGSDGRASGGANCEVRHIEIHNKVK